MNVWIFQDAPGVNMATQLQELGVGKIWLWNIDRYFRQETIPHIQDGDLVLQWQPKIDGVAPAGMQIMKMATMSFFA